MSLGNIKSLSQLMALKPNIYYSLSFVKGTLFSAFPMVPPFSCYVFEVDIIGILVLQPRPLRPEQFSNLPDMMQVEPRSRPSQFRSGVCSLNLFADCLSSQNLGHFEFFCILAKNSLSKYQHWQHLLLLLSLNRSTLSVH